MVDERAPLWGHLWGQAYTFYSICKMCRPDPTDDPTDSKIRYGNLSDICPRVLALTHISIRKGILSCLFRKVKSLSSEKLIPMEESKSMDFPTLLKENWRDNMLLLPYLLIERNLLLNMRTRLSNLLLFQLKVILLIQCSNHCEVHDVMTTQSIKKRFTML